MGRGISMQDQKILSAMEKWKRLSCGVILFPQQYRLVRTKLDVVLWRKRKPVIRLIIPVVMGFGFG